MVTRVTHIRQSCEVNLQRNWLTECGIRIMCAANYCIFHMHSVIFTHPISYDVQLLYTLFTYFLLYIIKCLPYQKHVSNESCSYLRLIFYAKFLYSGFVNRNYKV
jgi:hypothetical protein